MFFCLERGKGRRSFVEDCVVRNIVELSTMSIGVRESRVGRGGGRGYRYGLDYAVGGSLC